jgi:hypothetical protein
MDAEAELSPLLPAFKVGVLPALLASDPRDVVRVKNEPTLTLGDEPGLGSLQLCLATGSVMGGSFQKRCAANETRGYSRDGRRL